LRCGIVRGLLQHLVGREEVAAVDFLDVEVREAEATSLEIEPPAVFTSTGTEIA
jgi:hypothetical protein